jgi:hypothetical protein
MKTVFVALFLGFPVVGFAFRRWATVLLPLAGWLLYYIGLDRGWWGCCGPGEGWRALAVTLSIAGAATTVLAAAIGRGVAALR